MNNTARPTLPNWLEKSIFYGLAVVFVLLPLHAFLSTWGGTYLGPLWVWKSWKELLLFTLALLFGLWLLSKPAALRTLFRSQCYLWYVVSAFVVLVLALALFTHHTNGRAALWAGLGADLRYFVAFFLSFGVVLFGRTTPRQLLRRAAVFLTATGVVLAGIGLLQVTVIPRDFLELFGYQRGITIVPYMTIDEKSPELLRAYATLRGPNDFGAYLVMCFAAALSLGYSWRVRMAVAGLIGLGVFLSYSRSALAALLVVTAVWALLRYGRRAKKQLLIATAVGAAVFGVVLAAALSVPSVRLLVFHSSPHDSHLTEGNLDDHASSKLAGLERVVARPLGCGPGCSGPASYYSSSPRISENYYLQVAEAYGVVGFLLWAGVCCLVLRALFEGRNRQQAVWLLASFMGISLIGLVLHVWADDPLSISWWLCAGLALGYSERERLWNKSKNTSPSKTSSNS